MAELWAKIAQQVGSGSRTDILRSLAWPNALLLTALIWGSVKNAPSSLLLILTILLVFFMLLYAASFVFFAIKDPNMLRSEKFNIEKMAIERGLYGDDRVGLNEIAQPQKRGTGLLSNITPADPENTYE